MEEQTKIWRQTRRFSPRNRGKVDDGTIGVTRVQKITGERVLFINKVTKEMGAVGVKQYANTVKRTNGQEPIVVQSCQRTDTRPSFMKDDPGEVFLVDVGNGAKKLPPLYAPKNWENRLKSVGFFLAKTKKTGWRIRLKDIPTGCWARKNGPDFEVCNYQKIQR